MNPQNPESPKTDGASAQHKVEYPAVFHFRVIVEPDTFDEAGLSALLATYKVTDPLTHSRGSSTGRYRAYSVSVEMQSQEELHAFDAALKQVPGVRMVL